MQGFSPILHIHIALEEAAERARNMRKKMKQCTLVRANLCSDVPGRLRSTHDTRMQELSSWSLHEPQNHKQPPVFRMIPGGGIQLNDRFDVVSIQFAIHYMMETKDHACRFFRTVSQLLDNGGNLIATTIDARVIVSHLMKLGLNLHPEEGVAGNDEEAAPVVISIGDACEIKFQRRIVRKIFQIPPEDDKIPDSLFGLEYFFTLKDSLDQAAVNLPEWLAPIPVLVELAREVGLELEYAQNFHTFYHDHHSDPHLHPDSHKLLRKVMNHRGTISQSEWDISRLYVALKFRKVPEN